MLFVVGFSIMNSRGAPEFGTASAEQIRDFVESNKSALFWSSILPMLGWVALLWFLGVLKEALSRAQANQALVALSAWSGALTIAFFLIFHAIHSEFATHELAISDDVTVLSRWAIVDASFALFGGTAFLRVAFLGASSAAIITSRALPAWLGWSGAAVAAVNFLDGFEVFEALGFALVDFGLFLAWVLAASLVLVIKPAEP